jgi:uncharacterized membrane protein YdbT with pleckstrin-like domain
MSEKPLRVIHPVPVPIQFLIQGGILSAFMSLFPAVFTFILSNMIVGMLQGPLEFSPVLSYPISVYFLSFLGIMALLALKYLVEPAKTTYAIFPDRIECDEGLLSRNHRTLLFDQIIDIQLSEGLLQQTRGVGTLRLITQQLVSQGQGRLVNRSVQLINIPEPREAYLLVRSLAIKPHSERPGEMGEKA